MAFLLAAIPANPLLAQNPSSTLHGQVTDPSGAAVVGATVVVTSSAGQAGTAKTSRDGNYAIKGLAPGKYAVQANAKGFALYQQQDLVIVAGQDQTLDIQFALEPQKQEVVVTDNPTNVDVNPSSNASALVIKGKDLDALSDDPDELQSELLALAGPSAGPNGGQIYIDGFTGGQLPPKSSIREIRINQNPFSAEYDKLGYGRIEIFTKPGTDKLHGQFLFSLNDSIFNSQNPFSSAEPSYHTTLFSGNIGGPLGKKASFFFDAERRNIGDVSVVNATVPASDLVNGLCPAAVSLSSNGLLSSACRAAVANPRTRTSISPRLDYQVSASNTLTVRYRFVQNNETNDGVGQFSLASQGYNVTNIEQVLQISDTQILSPRTVNETRFQYERNRNSQIAQTFGPTVSVLGAFTSGGNSSGNVRDNQDEYELQNYTSMALGKHFLKFGGRLRAYRVANDTNSDFNGLFTFSQLSLYPNMPSQLDISCGPGLPHVNCNPVSAVIRVKQFDLGLYAQDDWRLRPNMTLSLGLRFETQNNIHDHADFAPRLGFAWGLGPKNAPPKTVLRLGFGVFYDRFADSLVLNADRLNGFNQSQCVDSMPDFPMTTCTPNGNQTVATIRRIDPNLHAPYTIQSAVSVERQLSKFGTVSITYINSRGVHAFLSRNINAPLPDGTRPFQGQGILDNIYNYESDGVFRQNQVIANFNVRAGTKLSLFGFYSLNYANSDTAGAGSFPDNQFDLAADYGRAAFDVRNRFFLGGTYALPYGLRVSPFLVANSGAPFNITLGRQLNGDSIFNDRPAFASTCVMNCTIVSTPFGTFNITPSPTEARIPPNLGTGPGQFTTNLRVSKTFGLGKKLEASAAAGSSGGGGGGRGGPGGGRGGPGGGLGGRGLSSGGGNPFGAGDASGRRYTLTFSVFGRNIFNNVNVAPPIGVVTSPFFNHSNALAGGFFSSSSANRRVDLQVTFGF